MAAGGFEKAIEETEGEPVEVQAMPSSHPPRYGGQSHGLNCFSLSWKLFLTLLAVIVILLLFSYVTLTYEKSTIVFTNISLSIN